MTVIKGLLIVLVLGFGLFFSVSEGYSVPQYCPGGTADCMSCHGLDYCGKCPTDPICSVSTNYTITASAGNGGSISPSGAVSVPGGNSQQFMVTPFAGYDIYNVLVDGSSIGAQATYTFANVIANHTIAASFFQPAGPPPVADFSSTPLTTTNPYIVSFNDLTTNGPTSWSWDFGDGRKSAKQNPFHAYIDPGTYSVTLEASSRNGTNIISRNITVAFTTCPNDPVDLGGWRQPSIQAAYDNAVNGEVIKVQATDFAENLNFNSGITVKLQGGFDCDYTMNPAETTISAGTLTVSSGTVIIENLILGSFGAAVLDGAVLYGDNCAVCHGDLANSTKIPTTTAAVQGAIDGNTGNMGVLSGLTPAEIQAIVDALNAQTPPQQSCTTCHGQPPNGTSFPNTAGAHAVHTELGLGSVTPTCAACHEGAVHLNSIADIGINAGFNALSGPADFQGDGTCSSTRCHGGQASPFWWSGSIDVNNDCASCHTRRNSGDTFPDQYNDYYSGRHRLHVVSEGLACTVCHNTTKLASGHFTNLETETFELAPYDTIGGGTTSIPDNWNGICNFYCHGKDHQNESW